jgi:hypothetical protein
MTAQKRSTNILLNYGQSTKDTIAALLLIVRVNNAGEIAGWDNARKLLEFKMCLRDKAVGWFEGLTEDGVDTNNWDTVKNEFLKTYEPKYSAKMTCANFTDLNQKSEETINDYMYRVQMAYKHLTDKKPAAMAFIRAAGGAAPADIKAEGVSDAFKFIKHQLFLAGLKDGIRAKYLRLPRALSPRASMSLAIWRPSKMITKGSIVSMPSSKSWKKKEPRRSFGTICRTTNWPSLLSSVIPKTGTTTTTATAATTKPAPPPP